MTINDGGKESVKERVWSNKSFEAPTAKPKTTDFKLEEHPIDDFRSLRV